MEGEGSSGKTVEKKYIHCYGVDLELKEHRIMQFFLKGQEFL